MADRLSGEQRREFLVQHKVPKEQHLVTWYGLSLDRMTKAELRIVIDNCVKAMEENRKRMKEVIFVG